MLPRVGSPAWQALQEIDAAGGQIGEAALARAMDLSRLELHQKLSYPMRRGLIAYKIGEGGRIYHRGDGAQLVDAPDPAPAAPAAQDAPLASSARKRTLAEIAPSLKSGLRIPGRLDIGERVEAAGHVGDPWPPHAPPAVAPGLWRRSWPEADAPAGEAGAPDGHAVDLDQARRQAPEISGALQLRQVGRLELALYTDGRALIELDGQAFLLSKAMTEKAAAFVIDMLASGMPGKRTTIGG